MDYFTLLPNEIIYHISLSLKIKDAIYFSLTNCRINNIINDNNYWRARLEKDYEIKESFDLAKKKYMGIFTGEDMFEGSEKYHPLNKCIIQSLKCENCYLVKYFTDLLIKSYNNCYNNVNQLRDQGLLSLKQTRTTLIKFRADYVIEFYGLKKLYLIRKEYHHIDKLCYFVNYFYSVINDVDYITKIII